MTHNNNNHALTVTIPVAGVDELHKYQKGLLAVLSEINIDTCDEELKENIKTVYQLLNHLLIDYCPPPLQTGKPSILNNKQN